MQEIQSVHTEPGVSMRRSRLEDSRVQPSSSRMLTNYLTDVEQNLDEHRWELAFRDVIDLPRIAVALGDPERRSSAQECKAWCERWIGPSKMTGDAVLTPEQICRVLAEKSAGNAEEPAVPVLALRRLRLRRHARNAPRGFNASHAAKDSHDAAETFAICTAVVEAVRHWYAHLACHDPTVQANLARLAVLR